jgi:adenine/guanine phosphoribosyltransferase-like PRPP-binding protein
LIQEAGGVVAGFNFLVELSTLEGNQRLRSFSQDIQSLAVY